MKLDKKYPEAKPLERHGNILRSFTEQDCAVCKRKTYWMETLTQQPICSEECEKRILRNAS